LTEPSGASQTSSVYETTEDLHAAIESRVLPKATLDTSFRDFQEAIDWKRLVKTAVVGVHNGKKELDIQEMLTDTEFAAAQQFYITTLSWNRKESSRSMEVVS